MKRASISWIAGTALLAVFALRTPLAGQAVTSNQDTLAALLVEVRGLRAAMEHMATAGPRVQLAFGRLQMQEQRVNTMIRRADDLQAKIAEADSALNAARGQLARCQRALEGTTNADEQKDFQAQVSVLKETIAQRTTELQRLQTDEAEVSSQVLMEQSRWTDINQRLEDLERVLAR
jgi:chromosome segregation ATPase